MQNLNPNFLIIKSAVAIDKLIDKVLALGGAEQLLARIDAMTAPAVAAE